MACLAPPPPTRVQWSLLTTTRLHRPSWSSCAPSSVAPSSSEMTWPPVSTARSSSIALRRFPKPGAFTATQCSAPRTLLTTRVASASASTSSAMISSDAFFCTTFSSSGSSGFMLGDLLVVEQHQRVGRAPHSIFSMSLTKYAERKPFSNCMPSTTSSSVRVPLASSTVITPSVPTRSMASATRSPTATLPCAEMENGRSAPSPSSTSPGARSAGRTRWPPAGGAPRCRA